MLETEQAFDEQLLEHPLIADLRNGRVQLCQYITYLRETWHLVRHTSRIFALAAARLPDDRGGFRDWLLEQAVEEHNHDLLCLADLRRLGVKPADIVDTQPGAGAWGLVTQDYFYAVAGNPLCLLGTASLSEQLGATVSQPVLTALEGVNGLPATVTGFIRAHGIADVGHVEQVQVKVDRMVGPKDFADVLDARRRAIGFSAQLLDTVWAAAVKGE